MNRVPISTLFTDTEMRKAFRILDAKGGASAHKRLVSEICEPAIERINKATGQENLPEYLAYVLEYAHSAHKNSG